jgi:hypothetical protein
MKELEDKVKTKEKWISYLPFLVLVIIIQFFTNIPIIGLWVGYHLGERIGGRFYIPIRVMGIWYPEPANLAVGIGAILGTIIGFEVQEAIRQWFFS